MSLPSIFNFTELMMGETYINELLETNKETKEYGLALTIEDVKQIINVRNKILNNYGRVELSFDVTKKIIEEFSPSAFIDDKNFVSTINELLESFYYLKNETEDKIGDKELIHLMKGLFENSCEGSIELLNSSLQEFSRKFREKLK